MGVLELTFYGNPISTWLVALAVAVAIGLGLAVLRRLIARRLAVIAERPRTRLDDAFLELIGRPHRLFVLILAVYAGASVLILPEPLTELADSIIVVALLAQTALWVNHLITTWLARQAEARGAEDPATATKLGVLRVPAQIAVWALVVLVVLDNLGIDVTALIAGLGVAGIAVAPATRFERGHFTGFGDSSLDFEFVYYMTAPDYAFYMDTQQAISLAILRRFEEDGVAFAYPTRTVFVERGEEASG